MLLRRFLSMHENSSNFPTILVCFCVQMAQMKSSADRPLQLPQHIGGNSKNPQGLIVLSQGQHPTYLVNGNFNYYVQLAQNSSIPFHSRTGQNINVNYNIWGPGTTNICANTTFNGPIGVAPSQNVIRGLKVIQYKGNALYQGRFFMKVA